MKRLSPLVLSVGFMTLASCGGGSAASEASGPPLSAPGTSVGVPVTDDATPLSTEGVPTEVPMAPAELLLDSSYDIEAIDGPVVLWFWAPG